MTEPRQKSAEEARRQLPLLLVDAENGHTTIITRYGRSVAALVPIEQALATRQKSLLPLAGSGKGLWSKDSRATVERLRDEWSK
jgi:antitoxin (DNA-binding transcriptional repressor) of toxin-antitoxin stability system